MNQLKNIEQDNYYLNLYKKQIRQDIKFFISSLKLNEIYFYGFTINYPNFINNKQLLLDTIILEKLKIINLLKNIDLIEFVYLSEELHGDKQIIREKNKLIDTKPLNIHYDEIID